MLGGVHVHTSGPSWCCERGSAVLDDDWTGQWKRVEIGLERVKAIYAGRDSGGSAEAVYDLYSFFVNCSHLADWLTKPQPPALNWSKVVKPHIKASPPLRTCRDLANRTKHFGLTDSPWISQDTAPTSQSVEIVIGGNGVGSVKHLWTIEAPLHASYDALELAELCVGDWAHLLRVEDLL